MINSRHWNCLVQVHSLTTPSITWCVMYLLCPFVYLSRYCSHVDSRNGHLWPRFLCQDQASDNEQRCVPSQVGPWTNGSQEETTRCSGQTGQVRKSFGEYTSWSQKRIWTVSTFFGILFLSSVKMLLLCRPVGGVGKSASLARVESIAETITEVTSRKVRVFS